MNILPPTNQKFRAKKTHARPPGPGELARASELHKRGLHLRLIEAQRPFPLQPESKRNPNMTEQELTSLRTVIRFLWRDEQRHFEECKLNDGEAPDDHVFPHLETLDHYLTREQAADVSPFI